mmetsp:Transcript_124170/g.356716  ORF Transcript_124170/g.356716 Transcript_124170/m.356716 type:complete len:243 (+) Transcript_124170:1448-2176(+)
MPERTPQYHALLHWPRRREGRPQPSPHQRSLRRPRPLLSGRLSQLVRSHAWLGVAMPRSRPPRNLLARRAPSALSPPMRFPNGHHSQLSKLPSSPAFARLQFRRLEHSPHPPSRPSPTMSPEPPPDVRRCNHVRGYPSPAHAKPRLRRNPWGPLTSTPLRVLLMPIPLSGPPTRLPNARRSRLSRSPASPAPARHQLRHRRMHLTPPLAAPPLAAAFHPAQPTLVRRRLKWTSIGHRWPPPK